MYIGYDAYGKLIKYNSSNYNSNKFSFIYLDIYNKKKEIKSSDLCIIKDVLQHLCNNDINNLLTYLITNKCYKYILLCNCCNQTNDNIDIINGGWRELNSTMLPLKKYNPIKLFTYNTKEVSLIIL